MTRMVILFGGIALINLPTIIVGNELLILDGIGAAVSVCFCNPAGQLREWVDAVRAAVEQPANKV